MFLRAHFHRAESSSGYCEKSAPKNGSNRSVSPRLNNRAMMVFLTGRDVTSLSFISRMICNVRLRFVTVNPSTSFRCLLLYWSMSHATWSTVSCVVPLLSMTRLSASSASTAPLCSRCFSACPTASAMAREHRFRFSIAKGMLFFSGFWRMPPRISVAVDILLMCVMVPHGRPEPGTKMGTTNSSPCRTTSFVRNASLTASCNAFAVKDTCRPLESFFGTFSTSEAASLDASIDLDFSCLLLNVTLCHFFRTLMPCPQVTSSVLQTMSSSWYNMSSVVVSVLSGNSSSSNWISATTFTQLVTVLPIFMLTIAFLLSSFCHASGASRHRVVATPYASLMKLSSFLARDSMRVSDFSSATRDSRCARYMSCSLYLVPSWAIRLDMAVSCSIMPAACSSLRLHMRIRLNAARLLSADASSMLPSRTGSICSASTTLRMGMFFWLMATSLFFHVRMHSRMPLKRLGSWPKNSFSFSLASSISK
mmetsp:Transcript_3141/g.5341  ORF Transcript_3141/g.5341 Transcript_3141/m.5341 type:complete len:479 (-) Transcript_3141:411-1847(-)